MTATKEQQFFNALRDVFVGAEVEGESGFVNLMRIKARYYERGVFPRLKEDIDRALEPFPEFREELFDRLYTFFRRYFSESGSLYFRFTPPHEHVYEKVYTDDRDVVLFWKTHMLYYVKTDRLFRSMGVEVDGFRFYFDAAALEHKRANERRDLVYIFRQRREDGTLVFTVTCSERGRTTSIDNIRRAVRDAMGLSRYTGAVPSEETLERAFRLFERQSEVDYFINKNARQFLREQFNLWLYQYVFEPEERQGSLWTERRIRQLQALKDIAYKMIDFIAQFEDELVRIWNKPKFVLDSHYIITLDRIAAQEGGREVLERLFVHPGMEAQLQEWRDLGMVNASFSPEQIWVNDLWGRRLHERYQYLPLDTRHFPDLEIAIVGLFDHLDQQLDGWLVHSENYQALNTLLPKFRGQVKCIYIDPPYNTGGDEFIYRDRFRHSSWLTMMENRLQLARQWLREDGALLVSIDYNEDARLRLLLEHLLGEDQYRNTMITARVKKSIKEKERVKSLNWGTGYMLFFAASSETRIRPPVKQMKGGPREKWHSFDAPGIRPTMEYEIFGQKPPPGRHWMYSEEKALEMIRRGELRQNPVTGRIEYRVPESPGVILDTNWTDLLESDSEWGFTTGKNPALLQRAINMLVEPGDLVLDYFAGSGTTAHAVIHLNRVDCGRRRYILVEMADYFYTRLLPRIKRIVFSDKWQDGIAQADGRGISHFVKYFRLEQYEEVLQRAHYSDDDAPLFYQDPYTQYVFLRDPKLLDNIKTGRQVVEVDVEQGKIGVRLDELYPNIDWAETISCLRGKWIRRVSPGEILFEDGTLFPLQPLDAGMVWETMKPLLWW